MTASQLVVILIIVIMLLIAAIVGIALFIFLVRRYGGQLQPRSEQAATAGHAWQWNSDRSTFILPGESLLMKAKQGDATSQYLLGLAYHHGGGVEKDPDEAAKWLRKAAEQGHEDAEVALRTITGHDEI